MERTGDAADPGVKPPTGDDSPAMTSTGHEGVVGPPGLGEAHAATPLRPHGLQSFQHLSGPLGLFGTAGRQVTGEQVTGEPRPPVSRPASCDLGLAGAATSAPAWPWACGTLSPCPSPVSTEGEREGSGEGRRDGQREGGRREKGGGMRERREREGEGRTEGGRDRRRARGGGEGERGEGGREE